MKVLIIGNGGREHALGWKIHHDKGDAVQLFFAPGNAGTAAIGRNVERTKIPELLDFAKAEQIDLSIVGPEALLVEGIVDVFEQEGLAIFGPNKKAAALEGSKTFAKDFMQKHGVKTAAYANFQSADKALEYVRKQSFPLVVKASGLAAGKGVLICENLAQAETAISEIMKDKSFGSAGNEIVIEDFLEGYEVSVLSVFNGKEITPFISAKDHKKIGEGETGLNTGGMGVVAPNPYFTEADNEAFLRDVLEPTTGGLRAEGLLFSGIIFFGLMVTPKGVFLLEYNLRMGDPETQAVLPLLESDLLDTIQASMRGEPLDLRWKNQHACCVVLASQGYPLAYEKGKLIHLNNPECELFAAGVSEAEGKWYTNGGRVLSLVGMGERLEAARKKTYAQIEKVNFEGKYLRSDIGA